MNSPGWLHRTRAARRAFDEGVLARVVTDEGAGARHCPVDVVGNLLKQGRAVSVLESLEDFANELRCNGHFNFALSCGLSFAVSRPTLMTRPLLTLQS